MKENVFVRIQHFIQKLCTDIMYGVDNVYFLTQYDNEQCVKKRFSWHVGRKWTALNDDKNNV